MQLQRGWIDLTSAVQEGTDDSSIAEIARVGVAVGVETTQTASATDFWALSLHQRFQDFKGLVQGPIDKIVGVINRIKGAVQSAIDAINRLRRERSVPLPSFTLPRHRVAVRRGQRPAL